MSFLVARDLCKNYVLGGRTLNVLKNLQLSIEKGEAVAVTGPSGIGKSTLLHLIGTLDNPTSGEISIDGTTIASLPADKLAHFRARHIGFVFQFHHLLAEFSALENVMLAGMIRGNSGNSRSSASSILQQVGLGERLDHRPGELSGGEQQRVALARALVNQPSLVLADEPTGNLDRSTAAILQDLIFNLVKERELSFLVVTHDFDFAARCDRILRLSDGQLQPIAATELS
ncbi:MAG: ABC transporter ATP-binding protein [bacterium]